MSGVDLSKGLIAKAKKGSDAPFHVHDITKPFDVGKVFDTVTIVLALQNLENPKGFFENAKRHLVQGGKLIIVMNHPCFRIPRQSSWEINETQKLQMRCVNRYMTPMEIPIQSNPSKGKKSEMLPTFSQTTF